MNIRKNSVVLFQGDSVTDCGRSRNEDNDLGNSYVKEVNEYLKKYNIKVINRAISGNRVLDLLNRFDSDFKDCHPDYIFIMIGVNDTWHNFPDSTPTDIFKERYELLINKIKNETNAMIIVLEPFIIGYKKEITCMRKGLIDIVDATRELAKKYGLEYLAFENDLATRLIFEDEELYSREGIHPLKLGYDLIAEKIIKNIKIID